MIKYIGYIIFVAVICILFFTSFSGCDEDPIKNTICYKECCDDIIAGNDRLKLYWSSSYIEDTCDGYCIPRCHEKLIK